MLSHVKATEVYSGVKGVEQDGSSRNHGFRERCCSFVGTLTGKDTRKQIESEAVPSSGTQF